jgi:hypothetical protein
MALNLTKGNIKSDNFSSSPDTRIRFVDPRVHFAQAKIAPITTLLEKMKRKVKADNYKVESNEKDIGTPTTTLNGDIDAVTTTVNVAAGTGTMFDKNDVLLIDDEQVLVTARTTDALTVTRNFGSEGNTTHSDGAEIVKLSSAYAENAGSGVGVSINPLMPYNICQIHRTPIDISRTEMQTDRYGEPSGALKTRLRDANILHMEAKERAAIIGQLKNDTSASRRTSRGILRYIQTHRANMTGVFTKQKFDSFLKDVMYNGDGNYYLFASGTFLEALHQEVLSNSNMNITPATKQWGLKITEYASPFGDLKIVYHRVLSHILEGMYGGCGPLINIDLLTEYYIQKQIHRPNIQDNDVDGRKDEYLEECCQVLNNEANNGFIYGV